MAKLKKGIKVKPFGSQCKEFEGEVPDSLANFFIEKGLVTKDDFETLTSNASELEVGKKVKSKTIKQSIKK
jgi:hypothetical protein